jgi:hypothetical protein
MDALPLAALAPLAFGTLLALVLHAARRATAPRPPAPSVDVVPAPHVRPAA